MLQFQDSEGIWLVLWSGYQRELVLNLDSYFPDVLHLDFFLPFVAWTPNHFPNHFTPAALNSYQYLGPTNL